MPSVVPAFWQIIKERSNIGQIISAALFFLIATIIRVLLEPIIPGRLPFITFYPVLVLGVIYCGFWPSVGILLASCFTGAWFWEPNGRMIENLAAYRVVASVLFILGGMTVIAPLSFALSFYRQIKERESQLEVINQELIHRIKNLSAVVNAIVTQSIKSELPREDLPQAISGRILAITTAERLSISTQGTNLKCLVNGVVEPMAPVKALFVSGPTVFIPKQYSTPFALVLHELATNALKYGAWRLPNEPGTVTIQWTFVDRILNFVWLERGADVSGEVPKLGLGCILIAKALSHATVRHAIKPEGAECHIELKLNLNYSS